MSTGDRMRDALLRFLEARLGQRIDRCALYPARVVSQDDDGQLEVVLDDTRFPSLTRVPIRTFAPGATIKVAAGARVLIGWESADLARPYAALWEAGTALELAVPVQTLLALAGGAQFVALANLVSNELTKIQTTLGTAVAPAGGGTVTYGTLYVPGNVAASKVKAE